MPQSTALWSHLESNCSKIFIHNHFYNIPIFLSLSTLNPPKWISKLLRKINFIFYFSQILKLCFLFLFFHIHSLGPMLHQFTKSFDLEFVLWSCRAQKKQPKITVHPLYISTNRSHHDWHCFPTMPMQCITFLMWCISIKLICIANTWLFIASHWIVSLLLAEVLCMARF
jgi:hypothetical protein